MNEPLDPKVAGFVADWTQANLEAMRIGGFGPNDPPPPDINPEMFRDVSGSADLGNPSSTADSSLYDEGSTSLPPRFPPPPPEASPLFKIATPEHGTLFEVKPPPTTMTTNGPVTQAQAILAPAPPAVDVWVADDMASYKGQPVELSGAERAAVSRIVIQALKRRLEAQYAEVVAQLPKRGRTRVVPAEAVSVAPPSAPKRRGRPPKQKVAS